MIADLPAVERRRRKPIKIDDHAGRTCFHEVCHVVAAVAMGYEPEWVDYRGPQADVAGRTRCSIGEPFDSSVNLLAGPIGEMYALGRNPSDGVYFDGCSSDFAKLKALIKDRRGRSIDGDFRLTAEYKLSFNRANELVRQHWLAIECLAEQLYVYKRLSSADIRRFLQPYGL